MRCGAVKAMRPTIRRNSESARAKMKNNVKKKSDEQQPSSPWSLSKPAPIMPKNATDITITPKTMSTIESAARLRRYTVYTMPMIKIVNPTKMYSKSQSLNKSAATGCYSFLSVSNKRLNKKN